jgi:hypothetical protein
MEGSAMRARTAKGVIVVGVLFGGAEALGSTTPVGLGTDGSALPAWRGRVEFRSNPITSVAVDIEYAVFAPGQFQLSTYSGGSDPSGGSEYIYAYHIDNNLNPHPNDPPNGDGTHNYISRFSVGLDGNEQPKNITFINSLAGFNPVESAFAPAAPPFDTATWRFALSGGLPYGNLSDVLIFSSPFGPELDNTSVLGPIGASLTNSLPSPTPEPGVLGVLGLAGVLGLMRPRRVR